MSRLWDLILQPNGLTTVFQPIFDARGGPLQLFALEALTRGPEHTNIERSETLFEYVRRTRREAEVDLLAMAAALREASRLSALPCLSMNVHAVTVERECGLPIWLADQAAEHAVALDRIIIEIVEHAPPWSGRQFLENLDRLRCLGIRIALDDVGLGQSNFRMIVDCRPDLLKIDRHFVDGCHADPLRRAVLESISELACRLGARSVAEGVEDERDVATVTALGITLYQGYLFCRPSPVAALEAMDFMAAARQPLSSPAAARAPSPLT